MWFIVGLFLGMAIGIRDKIITTNKLIERIIKGEPIQIGNKFYKARKVINEE